MTALNLSLARPTQFQQVGGSLTEEIIQTMLNLFWYSPTVYTASGAIAVQQQLCLLNGSSLMSMTLAAPTNPDDDGKEIIILGQTAFAHTIAFAGNLRCGQVGKVTQITMGSTIGSSATVIARGGLWWLTGSSQTTQS